MNCLGNETKGFSQIMGEINRYLFKFDLFIDIYIYIYIYNINIL